MFVCGMMSLLLSARGEAELRRLVFPGGAWEQENLSHKVQPMGEG